MKENAPSPKRGYELPSFSGIREVVEYLSVLVMLGDVVYGLKETEETKFRNESTTSNPNL